MTHFNFFNTFNMGYEGFSRPMHFMKMNPIYGNRGEIFVLLALGVSLPLLINGRKKNEDKLRSFSNATNGYAELNLDSESRKPSEWSD